MPDWSDPEVMDSSRYFAAACVILTWIMLGFAGDPGHAAKVGGVASVIMALSFVARAYHRGVLAGFPLWPVLQHGAAGMNTGPDADVWFAKSLAVTAIVLLTTAVLLTGPAG